MTTHQIKNHVKGSAVATDEALAAALRGLVQGTDTDDDVYDNAQETGGTKVVYIYVPRHPSFSQIAAAWILEQNIQRLLPGADVQIVFRFVDIGKPLLEELQAIVDEADENRLYPLLDSLHFPIGMWSEHSPLQDGDEETSVVWAVANMLGILEDDADMVEELEKSIKDAGEKRFESVAFLVYEGYECFDDWTFVWKWARFVLNTWSDLSDLYPINEPDDGSCGGFVPLGIQDICIAMENAGLKEPTQNRMRQFRDRIRYLCLRNWDEKRNQIGRLGCSHLWRWQPAESIRPPVRADRENTCPNGKLQCSVMCEVFSSALPVCDFWKGSLGLV